MLSPRDTVALPCTVRYSQKPRDTKGIVSGSFTVQKTYDFTVFAGMSL